MLVASYIYIGQFAPKDTTQLWVEPKGGGDVSLHVFSDGGWKVVGGGDGKSAYELAVEKGYSGTLDEWLDSLQGKSFTYDDLTDAQKAELAQDAVAAANRAAQAVETIEAAISDLDPSQSAEDAVVELAARQGVLENNIDALGPELVGTKQKVDDVFNSLAAEHNFSSITWNDNNLLRNNGGITVVDSGSYYNKCSTTDKIACAAFAGRVLALTHGNYGNTSIVFYRNPNSMISNEYHSYSGAGTENIQIPSTADFFRIGVAPSSTSDLSDAKDAIAATSHNVVSPLQQPFVKGVFTKLGYIRELYIPDATKNVSKIEIRKANELTNSDYFRSRIDITFSDSSTAVYDLTNVTEAVALKAFDKIVIGANNSFYILLSNEVPPRASGNSVEININELFNQDAVHILDYSPTIKEFIDKQSLDADIADVVADVAVNTAKITKLYNSVIETHNFTLAWNDNKNLQANGGVQNITQEGYVGRYATSDEVPCGDYVGAELIVNCGERSTDDTYHCFYNSSGSMLAGTERTAIRGIGQIKLTIPSGAAKFRIGLVVSSASTLSTLKAATSVSVEIAKGAESTPQGISISAQRMGAMKYALPTDFDYSQVLVFGQSFAQGGSSKTGTTGVIPNCLMFGDNVKDFTADYFSPLEQENYEYPVVALANALSRQYRRYGHNVNIVASTAGTGGVSITTLLTSYVPNVVAMHQAMKTAADGENKTVGCFAIVYMQGESDYREGNVNGKAAYKSYLAQVKNALQASAMENLGQDRKPLFFVYQTSGSAWVNAYGSADNEELGPSMAQIEFAEENDDVILISPAYQVTTYQDGHPATNGERWLGEYYAKAIWQTLHDGLRYKNPVPADFKVEKKRITIFVSDCVLPLQKNTWTLAQQTSYGFSVKADDEAVTIESVDLVDNAIILNLGSDISSASSVKISYGGVGVGKGNICDSDNCATWLPYLSDSGDTGYDGIRVITQSPTAKGGGSLVGLDYPMNNFLCIFFKEITQN